MLRKPLGVAKRTFVAQGLPGRRLLGLEAAVSDLQLLISADWQDDVNFFTSVNANAEVIHHSPDAILNNTNRPLLVPLLQLLYCRGALGSSSLRQEIVRFLAPSVHRRQLPWMWNNGVEGSSSPAETGDVSALRSLPPFTWRSFIVQNEAVEPSERLHYWHQVLFALSANPAFTEADTFDEAHREFLAVVDDYYSDVFRLQRLLPPLVSDTTVTRMPPVLVRKLRKLYAERCRLLDYAALFRSIVKGEELVMPACGTALMNDSGVFEYYITIPGRRESGMHRDERWPLTLEHATFAFRRLLRQRCWRGGDIPTMMVRPAEILMNACVFAKNDNAESDRYREAILVAMRVFQACCGDGGVNSSEGHFLPNDGFTASTTRGLLRILRDAGVNSMIAKCKALHFGPMRGLLDVCAVATTLECILCEKAVAEAGSGQHNFIWSELEVLLNHRKCCGCEMYVFSRGHRHHRFAARYGALSLGVRVGSALCTVEHATPFLRKCKDELAEWVSLIGRPLRLTMRSILSTPDLVNSSLCVTLEGLRRGECVAGRDEDSACLWTCGCKYVNVADHRAVSCVGCVSRHLVEHVWTCPHCFWVSSSGDPIDRCLECGRSHPCSLGVARNERVDARVCGDETAAPLWFCERCGSYSDLAGAVNGAETHACTDCGATGRGWATGGFEWKCGCGRRNSPLYRWCATCSAAKTAAGLTCPSCGVCWELSPRSTTRRDECLSCASPHPRDVAARRRRLRRCPFCCFLTPDDTDSCQNCRRPLGVLCQFLALIPDVPWCCHACGNMHYHRDVDGTLLQAAPGGSFTDVCAYCGVYRVDPVMFDCNTPWVCRECGDLAVHGCCCRRCRTLHPAIPSAEVHVWQCVVCNGVNNSWDSHCQLPGCGMRRSTDAVTLQYAPWCCTSCGKFSHTKQLPQCEHCDSARPAICKRDGVPREEQSSQRLAEVEAQLVRAASAMDEEAARDETCTSTTGITTTDDWTCLAADSAQLSISLA
uniref:RanBP2-type domain-containing protein n=1 Tax=Trypanosoma congolense (strain IL3000) TaxID=1068625 RepID=G0UXK4_TRYCI|nr:conserved hypothetical protein [Trypanosoma congolense IL3000]